MTKQTMLLTRKQAKAIYKAFCTLLAIESLIEEVIINGSDYDTKVEFGIHGRVVVERNKEVEFYTAFYDFVKAYDLISVDLEDM